jgi:CheY-like chemotaxis protein
VLLDMQMPEMDGLMLARKMQQDPELSGIRKVMMTSLGMPLKQEEAEASGIRYYLTKPFRPSSLFDALSSALNAEPLKRTVPEQGAVPGRRGESASRDFRILVAEDNLVNQKVALMQLQKAGYKADVAANGLEALAAVKQSHYDLVLMDCQMPEMDGFQATAEIRKLGGEKSRLPIIAMTANALEGDREKCLAAGMDDYLSKPVRLEALLKLVGKWDAVLDGKTILSLTETAGDDAPAFLSELVDIYLQDSSLRLTAIHNAVSGGDAAGLAAAAHALKGASANLGARRVEALCRRLEGLGRAGALEGAAELANALDREAELVKAALLAEREKRSQGGRGTAQ